jgi:N-acetylglucosaminyl-diphospho-decaprenol L-rhamnosyltransferase
MVSALRLAVIIVNWNTRDHLEACLRSLKTECAGLDAEIWVVDNASSDGSAEMVRAGFPEVRLIENDRNEGFGRACNAAFRITTDRAYVLFLNPDAAAGGGAVRGMAEFLDAHPEAGAVTCALTDGSGRFQGGQGRCFPTVRTAFHQYLFLNRLFSDRFFPGIYWARPPRKPCDVEWISGAVLMARRSAVEGPGFFDEFYFLYGEDLEASLAMRSRGWRLCYLPQFGIVHHMKAGVRKSGAAVFGNQVTGPLLFLQRHSRPAECARIRRIMAVGFWLRLAVFSLLSRFAGDGRYDEKSRHQRACLIRLAGARTT